MSISNELEVWDARERSSGWTPPGWRSTLRLNREPQTPDDLVSFVRAARVRLERTLRLGQPDRDDLCADGRHVIADAWLLVRLVADPAGWGDVPPEPEPDSAVHDVATPYPAYAEFRYET